ncbi:ankyrin [Bimuria novae-zelandiae CBS 107.79]|uniref:Ankyrin n=1 Tax=Bimuria novae-zelandiae CBS 107.79 TaxID=1447943 RepID=A0A6A5V5E6_9PLEO|nr:ankyrin [Bimuria novae-zelandiae CBS 107.79]
MVHCKTTAISKLFLRLCKTHLLWVRDPHFHGPPQNAFLMSAIRSKTAENVRLILYFPFPDGTVPYVGMEALCDACTYGSLEVVTELLKHMPTNEVIYEIAPYRYGETALTIAIRYGDLAMVKAVLEAGADIHGSWESRHFRRVTIRTLHLAMFLGKKDIVRILIERGRL